MAAWQVEATVDDGVRYGNAYENNTSGQYYGNDGAWNKNCHLFYNVTIPQGSTIDSAKIAFCAIADLSDTAVNVVIDAEDVDTATEIINKEDFDARVRTTAKVHWDGLAGWTTDSWYDSPSIITVIQEIVDRGSWASGNAMQIFCDDDSSDGGAYRKGYTWEQDDTLAAILTITWTPPGGVSIPVMMHHYQTINKVIRG